ncbi:hypothetical protein D2E16_02570 [Streptococcus suis]|nr:hypothetical protein D2E16_02570 [Streptococcus suis]
MCHGRKKLREHVNRKGSRVDRTLEPFQYTLLLGGYETTNNLIKVIKKNAFGFRKMKTRKTDFDALNSEKLRRALFRLYNFCSG